MGRRTEQRQQAGKWLVTWRLAACAAVVAALAIHWVTAAGGAAAAGRAAAPASGETLRAWGNNSNGQLGNGMSGSSIGSPVKVRLPSGVKITSVRAGCAHTLALTTTGKVLAWGDNRQGQLGDGTEAASPTPAWVKLPAGTKVKAIRAGCAHSLALTTTGKVLAWGRNGLGQLGNGTEADRATPVRVRLPAGVKVTAISAGWEHSLAVTSTGRVLAWGDNSFGQLGTSKQTASSDTPLRVKLPAGTKVIAVAAGWQHSLALTSKDRVLGWGDNFYGELGNGTTSSFISPPVRARLPAGIRVRGLYAGCGDTLALTSAGKVLGWGSNSSGQLGHGTSTRSIVPVRAKIPAGTAVTAISAGCIHSLALTSKGRVLTWGDNDDGELGNGATSSSSTPVRVALPAGLAATAIGAGPAARFSLAIVRPRP
jgi:alpha-tubulin suppressor-like RCC1 family protein